LRTVRRIASSKANCVYQINTNIGIYIKHSTDTPTTYSEYVFNFKTKNLEEIEALKPLCKKLFIVLVCIHAHEICCISYKDFAAQIEQRKTNKKEIEKQYNVLVTAEKGKSFRVYMNAAGKKRTRLKALTVPRNAFPSYIFE